MIDQIDVDHLEQTLQPAGCTDILTGRVCPSAGVVMGKDDVGRIGDNRRFTDLADADPCSAGASLRQLGTADQTAVVVQAKQENRLISQAIELAQQILSDLLIGVEQIIGSILLLDRALGGLHHHIQQYKPTDVSFP